MSSRCHIRLLASRLRLIGGGIAIAAFWLAAAPCAVSAQATAPQAAARPQETNSPGNLFREICVASDARKDLIVADARAAGFTLAVDPKGVPEGAFDVAALDRDTATGRQQIIAATSQVPPINDVPDTVKLRSCSVSLSAPGWDGKAFLANWLGMTPALSSPTETAFYYTPSGNGYGRIDRESDPEAYLAALNAGALHIALVLEQGDHRNLTIGVFDKPDHPLIPPPATEGAETPGVN